MKKYKSVKPMKPDGTRNIKYRSKNKKLGSRISEIEKNGINAYEKVAIAASLQENRRIMQEAFKNCSDIVLREFRLGSTGQECLAVFLDEMVDKATINISIIKRLMSGSMKEQGKAQESPGNTADAVMDLLLSTCECMEVTGFKAAIEKVLEASCVIFVDGLNLAFAAKAVGEIGRSVSSTLIEQSNRGPQDAFVEDIDKSLPLVRKRLKTPELKMENSIVGTQSQTRVVLSYISGIADKGIIEEARRRLGEINVDVILDTGEIRSFFEDDPLSPFPQVDITERPDVVVAALAEGRIAIFADGSPFVMLAPTTFAYLFNIADDYYERIYFNAFIRLIRYMAFFIALLGPSLYIAITTYHPEMIPQTLLISMVTVRSDVPFPAILEALLMEVTFEIVREVSVRLPKNMGQSLSIVGGLVIGQISVQAGLVSPIMIIVVAVTGLASFLIPKLNSARQISVLRFPMMLLAAFQGTFGLIMGGLLILIHLASLRSMGVPYLSPTAPFDAAGIKDTIIRLPLWMLTKRPAYIQRNNVTRTVPPDRFRKQNNG